jgi:hypothetical protein
LPDRDLARLREEEDRILESYAWEDRANGWVRVPIDKAIDRALQRGFPVRRAP